MLAMPISLDYYGLDVINLNSLHHYSLFGGLNPEEIKSIQPYLVFEDHPIGFKLMRENELNDKIFFIIDGRVEVSRGGAKLAEMSEGSSVGEMEFLSIMPNAATVTCLSETRVAIIKAKYLNDIFKGNLPAFAMIMMNIARDLARRLHRMDEMITTMGKREI